MPLVNHTRFIFQAKKRFSHPLICVGRLKNRILLDLNETESQERFPFRVQRGELESILSRACPLHPPQRASANVTQDETRHGRGNFSVWSLKADFDDLDDGIRERIVPFRIIMNPTRAFQKGTTLGIAPHLDEPGGLLGQRQHRQTRPMALGRRRAKERPARSGEPRLGIEASLNDLHIEKSVRAAVIDRRRSGLFFDQTQGEIRCESLRRPLTFMGDSEKSAKPSLPQPKRRKAKRSPTLAFLEEKSGSENAPKPLLAQRHHFLLIGSQISLW